MRKPNIFTSGGMLLYVALSVIDRFFCPIPDGVYIPLCLAGLGLMLLGLMRQRKKNNK